MIRNLRIENFRLFRSFDLSLEPLTVLVGPNAGGKSTVVDALAKLAPSPTWTGSDRNRGSTEEVAISAERMRGDAAKAVFHPDGSVEVRSPLRSTVLRTDPRAIRCGQALDGAPRLAADAGNLTYAFAALGRDGQAAVAKRFTDLVGSFADLEVEPSGGVDGRARLVLRDRWDPAVELDLGDVSDGSLRILAALVLIQQCRAASRQGAKDEGPEIVAIEDLDHGPHPYLLAELIADLRELTEGRFVRPVQVLLTTHSPQLLNLVAPEEVRFLSRDWNTGSVTAESAPTCHADWEKSFAANDRALGPMWMMGGLGGVPPV